MNRFVAERITPAASGAARVAKAGSSAVVIGGGIAGISAAVVLAERGVRVTLLEREGFLGGRAGAWNDRLADGTPFEMERGFHAFFRQYYNLRALMRRVDPALSRLRALNDYPLFGPNGAKESFAGLPRRTPFNLLELIRRTPTIRLADLPKIKPGAAFDLLSYAGEETYARFDGMNAKAYFDALNFPPDARLMLFEVFSHSFFNPEETMSAGELLMQFHFYFTGNPEGLVFDVLDDAFSTALWTPMSRYLRGLGVELRLNTSAESIARDADGWRVKSSIGAEVRADAVVLACEVPGLKRLVAGSPGLDDATLRAQVDSLGVTSPFVVWRLWLDTPPASDRAAFVGTAGLGLVDNVSLYHLFEDESRAWSARTGGSVVELHAYGVPEHLTEAEVRASLLAGLHAIYPEYRGARVIEERYLARRDCASFETNSHALRPGVETELGSVVLAGDFVKLPFPTALMERAASSGFMAANALLARLGVAGEPVWSVPRRGLLTRRSRLREVARTARA